jgi:3-oxoacyl-[acyl-carrier protein] reductase
LAAEKIVSTIKSKGKGDAIAVKADVGGTEGVTQLLDESVKAFGKVDALVLNAGISLPMKTVVDIDEEFFDVHMNTNVKGPLFAVKHAVDKGMFPQGKWQNAGVCTINTDAYAYVILTQTEAVSSFSLRP